MEVAFGYRDVNCMIVMNLHEYKYLRQFNIVQLPEFKDIDIANIDIWSLNPERIYINSKLLRNNLRLLYIAHKMLDKSRDDKIMIELMGLLNENK